MIAKVLIISVFLSIWIVTGIFMFWMTLTHGGFSDGAMGKDSYGNLIGLFLWFFLGGGFNFVVIKSISGILENDY